MIELASLLSKPRADDGTQIVRMAAQAGVLDDLPLYRELEDGHNRPPKFADRVVWRFAGDDEKTEIDHALDNGNDSFSKPWRVSCRADTKHPHYNYPYLTFAEAYLFLQTGQLPAGYRELE